ncbi:TPA: DUF1642 domain-containing protein [Enterococcus faecium]
MNKQELIETLEELNKYSKRCIGIDKHEDYWRGKTDAYFNLIGLVKQLDEPKKLVIPQLVAGWLEKSTDPFTKAEKIAYLIKSKDGDSYYFCDWFVRDGIVTQEQGEELLAWVTRQSYETLLSLYNGYEVEKEPVWAIKNADGNYLTKCALWGKDGVNYSFECNPSHQLLFTDKATADAAALLVNGTVEEVVER